MTWVDRMNAAIDYIEAHLGDEMDIDMVAQKVCCSYYNFQRIFSFIFNMPLADYIRGRRLTLAAAELMHGKKRVIDVALQYGYGSQEAFSRAFMKRFGVSPSNVKALGTVPDSYPRAVISMNERADSPMNHSFLLEKKQPASIFKTQDGLMGWMRFSITVWSYLQYIGQTNDPWQVYSLIASLCGEAFGPVNYTVPASGIRHMLKTLGFTHEVYSSRSGDADYIDRESMRRLIVSHISEKRLPVVMCNDNALSLGSRGIVIGYENGGDKLIYWGCFPFLNGGSDEPIHIPVENWYTKHTTFTLIGEREAFPEPEAVYSAGIRAALNYLCDGEKQRNDSFYDEWKRVLKQTPDEMIEEIKAIRMQPRAWSLFESFFDDDVADVDYGKMILEIIDPLWCDFALRRACASMVIGHAKDHLPGAREYIGRAQAAFMNIHNLMNEYPRKVGCIPGEGVVDRALFADQDIRNEMIGIVERCRREERNAVAHLRNACGVL